MATVSLDNAQDGSKSRRHFVTLQQNYQLARKQASKLISTTASLTQAVLSTLARFCILRSSHGTVSVLEEPNRTDGIVIEADPLTDSVITQVRQARSVLAAWKHL